MSRLVELTRKLQESEAAAARAERTLAAHPDIPSALATLQSVRKFRSNLEQAFLEETNALEVDVCPYRILPDRLRPTATGIGSVLLTFQKMFTTVYDAVVNGPKQTAKMGLDIEEKTSFGFAYAFQGSIGMMLTLENKRMLVGATELDQAMAGVFDLMQVKDQPGVLSASKKYGTAAIRMVNQWADANVAAGFGADIAWMRRSETRARILIQNPEVQQLSQTIKRATETNDEEATGEIVALDIGARQFRMRTSGTEISGTFSETTISRLHPAIVPGFYKVNLRLSKRLISEGDNPIDYELLDFTPLST